MSGKKKRAFDPLRLFTRLKRSIRKRVLFRKFGEDGTRRALFKTAVTLRMKRIWNTKRRSSRRTTLPITIPNSDKALRERLADWTCLAGPDRSLSGGPDWHRGESFSRSRLLRDRDRSQSRKRKSIRRSGRFPRFAICAPISGRRLHEFARSRLRHRSDRKGGLEGLEAGWPVYRRSGPGPRSGSKSGIFREFLLEEHRRIGSRV